MPRVVVTEGALRGLQRCRDFLSRRDPTAAIQAGRAIKRRFLLLEAAPEIGRPLADGSELRELIIPFGDSGYVALYRYEEAENTVYVLAVRYQREAGF